MILMAQAGTPDDGNLLRDKCDSRRMANCIKEDGIMEVGNSNIR